MKYREILSRTVFKTTFQRKTRKKNFQKKSAKLGQKRKTFFTKPIGETMDDIDAIEKKVQWLY